MIDHSETYNITISSVSDGSIDKTMSFSRNRDYDFTGGEPGELAELLVSLVFAWLTYRGWVRDFLDDFNDQINEQLNSEAKDRRLETESKDERTDITID